MTQKQFATRKASLALLHPEQAHCPAEQTQDIVSSLQFKNRSGARLLVKPTAGGAIGARRQCFSHAAFCSVSTAAAASSSTPIDCARRAGKDGGAGSDASGQHGRGPASLERLPVAVKKGDQLLPYVWDGHRITAMNEAALQDADVNTGRLRNWVLGLQRQLRQAFLPDPRDVTPDYWEWLRWRLSQRFFSSTMQNFSFSALLMATGLGAKKAFAASAAINWLLKDGVSRIVRMSVATSFGQTFDADLKRMRFITSLIFTACMAGEFATPFWPQHFVALASVSSVGRAVGLSAFVAVQPAFQAALATGGNLADLTSKNQAQHMVMDMMALGVSAGLTWLCRAMPRGGLMLPAIMYPICAAGDLTCIWHELKAVQLRTLNRERAEMVIERWMRRGTVPDAAEISAAESLVLPSDVWRGLLPLRIIPLDRLAPADPAAMRDLLHEYDSEEYVLHVTAASAATAGGKSSGGGGGGGAWRLPWLPWLPGRGGGGGGGGGAGGPQPEVLVSLSDRATPSDIAKALLHAAYLRKAVLDHFVTHGSEPHHHHHKQLHHHSHLNHHGAAQAASSSSPLSPEVLLRHHNNHHHNHHHNNHNNHNNHHREHDGKAGAESAPDRDVANRHNNDKNGRNGHNNGHNADRDQFPGIHELLERRQELAHQNGGGGGGGGGGVLGHAHEHLHWDPTHHMLYHHNHYHTHQLDAAHGHGHGVNGHDHGHGHSHGVNDGGGGGAALASARTASVSLSPGCGTGSNSSSSGNADASSSSSPGGGGGCCAAGPSRPGGVENATAAEQQQQWHHKHQTHRHHAGGHSGGDGGPGPGSERDVGAPEPRWEQLDDAAWGSLIRSSRREAARNLSLLLREAEQAGWKVKPFMLNTTERVTFVRL
ncbi:hypothetical protein PLESTB_001372700 [Pleodorina starrii]|uniref:Protein root UVB sensitive/RUS domain-containing protein n=1 Tax=Pleodorina starrii TaxID=330485 RepID=A0A9W6F6W5_9CHLO|nr:hypothetical protein PLESTM_000412400 [Pleodorina starrii]GLC58544.1 hypothetical protein PLESTB_001372700 [Pleodorina starrii]GLC74195.1 hypothetical protein PLESTF_001472400 [Pleodorina starrii]